MSEAKDWRFQFLNLVSYAPKTEEVVLSDGSGDEAAQGGSMQTSDPQNPTIRSVKVGDLEWQADVPDRKFTWQEAQEYAASLGDGWRVPTIKELLTLVDYTSALPACSVFPDCPSEWFWSSSALSGSATDAWDVDFYYGDSGYLAVGSYLRVRCVR